MIILYTFDYYPTRQVSLDYLRISLQTIESLQWHGDLRILIYTTDVEGGLRLPSTPFVRGEFDAVEFPLEIRHYEQETPLTVNWDRYPPGWSRIGHSRIYLIPYLLQTYHEPVLYLDCDTAVIGHDSSFLDHLLQRTTPLLNAAEEEQTIQLYGETHHLRPQKIPYLGSQITTRSRSINGRWIEGRTYSVTMTTKNNGILYFPYNDMSQQIACETINVYEQMMSINPSGFHDLNAISCVISVHQELPCPTMFPLRVFSLQPSPYDHLTHYFTISYLYMMSQNDSRGYQNILQVYRTIAEHHEINKGGEAPLQPPLYRWGGEGETASPPGGLKEVESPLHPPLYRWGVEGGTQSPPGGLKGDCIPLIDLTSITGSCYESIPNNLLETIFFPLPLIAIFHPNTSSLVTQIHQAIRQQLRIRSNYLIVSYLTFILLVTQGGEALL